MKVFVEEFDVKNSEPDICRFLENIIESDEFDKDDKYFRNRDILRGKNCNSKSFEDIKLNLIIEFLRHNLNYIFLIFKN